MEVLSKYPLALTIVFIFLAALVAILVRRLKRDRCLKSFNGDGVVLEDTQGNSVSGGLRVANTGLELLYRRDSAANDTNAEASYILYKHEFAKITAIVRPCGGISERRRRKRIDWLRRTRGPGLFQRAKRAAASVSKTLRDALLDIANMLFSAGHKVVPVAGVLKSQERYVSQMRQDLLNSFGTAYEPLIERHIGRRVVVELIKADRLFEYTGVLKDYTSDFVQLLDVSYSIGGQPAAEADVIFSRQYGIVRHLAERPLPDKP